VTARTIAITASDRPVEISGIRVILEVGEVQDQLDADEGEDRRQSGRKVHEPVEQAGDEEVQGSQAE
jgi:hypothetical protein